MRVYFQVFGNNLSDYIFRCKDYGQYISELIQYAKEGIMLLETIEVGKEPLFFVIVTNFIRLSGLEVHASYILIESLIHVLLLLAAYIIVKNITKNKIIALICLIILGNSLVNNLALDSLFSRQNLANFYLLFWCMSMVLVSRKSTSSFFVVGIFLAWSLISHRVGLMFVTMTIVLLFGYNLYKKNQDNIKILFYTSIIGIILATPILWISIPSLYSYITAYIDRYIKIMNWTQEYLDVSSLSLSQWVSLLHDSGYTPIIDYAFSLGFLLAIFLAGIKFNIIKWINSKKYLTILTMGLLVVAYETTNMIFWNRIIILADMLIIVLVSVTMWKIFPNKLYRILIINIGFCLLLTMYAPLTITGLGNVKNRVLNIKTDASISFIKNNIDPENSFLIGDHCVSEFGAQIGYKTSINFGNLTVWWQTEKMQNGGSSFEELGWRSNILARSLFAKNYMIGQLKGQDLYIPLGPYFEYKSQKYMDLIKKNDPRFFSADYIKLIYTSPDPTTYIRYIFKVDTSKLTYFDDVNYFDRTLANTPIPK